VASTGVTILSRSANKNEQKGSGCSLFKVLSRVRVTLDGVLDN
jgi:hypothetical protein